MTRGSRIVFCSNLPGRFDSMGDTTSRLKGSAMAIKPTLNPLTKPGPMSPISFSPLVITGEVNSLVCLSRTDKASHAWRQLLFGICLLAFSGSMQLAGAAPLLSRQTFQTSDGVTLSVLETDQDQAKSRRLTIACVPGWSMRPISGWTNRGIGAPLLHARSGSAWPGRVASSKLRLHRGTSRH